MKRIMPDLALVFGRFAQLKSGLTRTNRPSPPRSI